MAQRSSLEYTPLPERAQKIVEAFIPSEEQIEREIAQYAHVKPRAPDKDLDTEVLDGVVFTHHFVLGPGDAEVIQWHYVEAGPGPTPNAYSTTKDHANDDNDDDNDDDSHYKNTEAEAEAEVETIVFLHGIPDAWYQWHHQMSHLSKPRTGAGRGYRCIAVDLKGYGQSDKAPGDYRHEGAGEQLFDMLQLILAPDNNTTNNNNTHTNTSHGNTNTNTNDNERKVVKRKRFNLVTHDRGTVQADFIVANHPDSIIRYMRGEQHLYHFNPLLAPQGDIFKDAPWTGIMEDPIRFVVWVHNFVRGKKPLPPNEMERVIQEFSYPGISRAVPRYFNSSSFRIEWLQRRQRLLKAWKCPVLIMQGYDSKSQPREFYENARDYIPNAERVAVQYIPGGHFWTLESPKETTDAIERFMKDSVNARCVTGKSCCRYMFFWDAAPGESEYTRRLHEIVRGIVAR
nr:hypothetical protein LTR18_003179 [Exophiala xenobiotica]